MIIPCSYSSQDSKKRESDHQMGQTQKLSALIYRTASCEPDENSLQKQNIPRVWELFIPSLQLCYTAGPVHEAFFASKPRNIYAIDYNPLIAFWTTRPLTDGQYVESALKPIQISADLAEAISKLAILSRSIFTEEYAMPIDAKKKEYEWHRASVSRRIEEEILKGLPENPPSKDETPLNPRRNIPPLKQLNQMDIENECVWYARFRSPDGLNLYQASSPAARQLLDSARAEIKLAPQVDAILQDSMQILFANSSPDAQTRYQSADAAVQKNPADEALKQEKREAYIILYKSAAKPAQDFMDYAFCTCFKTINYDLRKKLNTAMIKLYADAPEAVQKAFDDAWA